MKIYPSVQTDLDELVSRLPHLSPMRTQLEKSFQILYQTICNKGKILIAGNGGSAADAEHIVGELLKNFRLDRRLNKDDIQRLKQTFPDNATEIIDNLNGAIPAISLNGHFSFSTAFANDVNPVYVIAQHLYALGQPGDTFIAISTSGNSPNIVQAVKIAQAFSINTIGLSGENGGNLKDLCDVTLQVPSTETDVIQEMHSPVYHFLCHMLEKHLFEAK